MEKSIMEILNDEGIFIKNYNPHPFITKRGLNDCYIRALVKFLDLKYEDVYNELFEYAKQKYLQPNDPIPLYKFYRNHGLKIVRIPINKRESLLDFIVNHKNQDMIIMIRRHMIAYKDKILYDFKNPNEDIENFIEKFRKYIVVGYIIKK